MELPCCRCVHGHFNRRRPPVPSPGIVFWLIILLLEVLPAIASAESAQLADSFGITSWGEQSALPSQSIVGVLQGRDGFLWLATDSGVVRFDGIHFKLFSRSNFGLLSNAVTAIGEDGHGNIIAGFESGGLCVLRSQAAECESVAQGFPRGAVRTIQADSHGTLWIALRGGGLVRQQGSQRRVYGREDGMPSLNLATLYVDRHDIVWVGTYDGGLVRIADSQLSVITEPKLPSGLVWSIAGEVNGNVWVATVKGLCRFAAGSLESVQCFGKADGLPGDNITHVYIDALDRVWASADHGGLSLKLGPKFVSYTVADGLADMTVDAITADSEGDIWVGTEGGLSRLRSQSFRSFNSHNGLHHEGVRIVFEDHKGTVWLGLSNGGLQQLHMAAEPFFSPEHLLDSCAPLAGLVAEDATIWLGCSGGTILHVRKPGDEQRFPLNSPGHVVEVNALAETAEHRLFAATFGDGVAEFRNGAWVPRAILPQIQNVNAIRAAPQGLWIATYDSGLYYMAADGGSKSYADQLGGAIPTSLNMDSDGSVWVKTDQGLMHVINGQAEAISFQGTPLADATIYNVLADLHGQYWISSSLGIARVSREALLSQHLRPETIRLYTAADGVRGINYQGYAQPTALVGSDGRLYFGTSKGASIIDSNTATAETPAITVRIDEVLIDDRKQNLSSLSNGTIISAAGSHQVEFAYRAPLLGATGQVLYRYRLTSFDQDWIYAGDDRAALYRELPPGTYTFQVQASLVQGLWSSPVTEIRLVKRPHLYQKWWFQCALALIAVLLIRLFYLRKIGNVRRAEARLQSAISHERSVAAQQQTRELTQMNESLRATLSRLSDGSDLPTIMRQVLVSAVQQLRGRSARIFLANEETGRLEQRYASDSIPESDGEKAKERPRIFTVPFDKVPLWLAQSRTRQSMLLDLRKPTDAALLWDDALRWHRENDRPYLLSEPMMLSSRVLGLLYVEFQADIEGRLTPEQLELAHSLASLASMALETHRLSLAARDAAIADERTRLSEEMHDGIQQIFTAISIQVATATNRAHRALSADEIAPDLERIAETAEHGIAEIRRAIRALHAAATMDGQELLNQLALLCSSMSATGLACSLHAPDELDLAPSTRLNDLYRIAQEAVANANKHAHATQLDITLEKRSDGLLLSVADNGRGLQQGVKSAGFGLRNMEERARRLHTGLTVKSSPEGTVVSLEVRYVDLR